MTVRRRRCACGGVLVATLVGALALPALAAKDDLDLVSRASGGGASRRQLLRPGDLQPTGASWPSSQTPTTFRRGRQQRSSRTFSCATCKAGTTTLASVTFDNSAGANDASSLDPAISADGSLRGLRIGRGQPLRRATTTQLRGRFRARPAGPRHHHPRERHLRQQRRRQRQPLAPRRSQPTGALWPSSPAADNLFAGRQQQLRERLRARPGRPPCTTTLASLVTFSTNSAGAND